MLRLVRAAQMGLARAAGTGCGSPSKSRQSSVRWWPDADARPKPTLAGSTRRRSGGRSASLAEDAGRLHDDLASDDRPDPRRLARLVEPDRSRQPLVVGERERGHLEFGRTGDERRERRRAVHEAELRMNVKVHESG